jgi:hypothetical protein
MAEGHYVWFIEPLNSYTNEVISRMTDAEDFLRGILCGDGKSRNFWRCSFEVVSCLRKSRGTDHNLDFNVFNKCGDGKIRDCIRWFKRKRPKMAVLKQKPKATA